MEARRTVPAVVAAAVLVYAGALANRFALDDLYIIVSNPIVRGTELWRAFVAPYWPADLGGKVYRPLPVATYALDWLTASTVWFHFVNVAWHAATSVLVALLARRWAGERAALAAGLLFAVHPVHVEAVANVVGRSELMAGLFAVLAVYLALARGSLVGSTLALVGGLLSKENAAVVPGLVVWGWLVGLARPSRKQVLRFAAAWVLTGGAYLALRWWVVHPYAHLAAVAPVFVGQGPVAVRLTAVAALADVTRLLVLPATLRVDYSPAERTLVTSPLDPRCVAGVACVLVWGALLVWAWRRGRRLEAFGLGWVAIALSPVANLLFPIGVLVAERTLYLPSAGLTLAVGAALGRWGERGSAAWAGVLTALVVAGALRTVTRVPVWRDDATVVASVLEDSPHSYRGYAARGGLLLRARRYGDALGDLRRAAAIYGGEPAPYIAAADAAFGLGRPTVADSLLDRAARACPRCGGLLRFQAGAARARGDSAVADSLLAHAEVLAEP